MEIELLDTAFDPGAALAAFTRRTKGAGGIVSFTGHVRPQARSGAVSHLHLQTYAPMTRRGIENAVNEAKDRWPLDAVSIIHRTGDILAEEAIVFVAAASAHRRAAFQAADFLMDYLKTDAIFWKKEYTTQGEEWIEPRAEDYADKTRWTSKEHAPWQE